MLAIATFGIPILGSLLTLLADRVNNFLRNAVAALTVAATLASAFLLIPIAKEAHTIMLGPSTIPGFGFNFIIDGLGVYVAIMAAFIGLLIVFYSMGYMQNYTHLGEYYFLVVLFIGAMMGLVLSANLLLIYIFWEVTAICSWRLIGFFRDPQHLKSADTALLMTVFGSFCMLVGMEMVWHETGTLTIAAIRGRNVSDMAMLLMFIGILAKSAQVPLQIWLPAAGVAPSPVTALLHAAVLVVIGVFAFARIFIGAFSLPPNWQTITSVVATITIFVASGAALVENNAKRILAYSTFGQLAYVYLGFASMTTVGIVGGLVFLLAHSLAKAGLFLAVGIVEHKTHTKDIRELGGMIRVMPVTAVAFILCALTIIGFPPSAGFVGKFMIILGAVEGGKTVFAALAVFGALMSIAYMIRLFNAVFLGPNPSHNVKEGTTGMVVTVTLFAVLSLLAGIIAAPLLDVVNALVSQMFG
ncbi:MAG: NADH-quinone oxidoreductase subunit L [Chloroflexi bacterium]|nr:NADH-quinone oxidoreductase subunit L [Chloroflexota bacterium]